MDETVTVRKRADESARKSHIGPGEKERGPGNECLEGEQELVVGLDLKRDVGLTLQAPFDPGGGRRK
jgi:hypothetical protein